MHILTLLARRAMDKKLFLCGFAVGLCACILLGAVLAVCFSRMLLF